MARLFDRVLPESANSLVWNMTAWVPHAVVINLGTNDLSASHGPFTAEHQKLFVEAYRGAQHSGVIRHTHNMQFSDVAMKLFVASVCAIVIFVIDSLTASFAAPFCR